MVISPGLSQPRRSSRAATICPTRRQRKVDGMPVVGGALQIDRVGRIFSRHHEPHHLDGELYGGPNSRSRTEALRLRRKVGRIAHALGGGGTQRRSSGSGARSQGKARSKSGRKNVKAPGEINWPAGSRPRTARWQAKATLLALLTRPGAGYNSAPPCEIPCAAEVPVR
jgi:hypothetical protein